MVSFRDSQIALSGLISVSRGDISPLARLEGELALPCGVSGGPLAEAEPLASLRSLPVHADFSSFAWWTF